MRSINNYRNINYCCILRRNAPPLLHTTTPSHTHTRCHRRTAAAAVRVICCHLLLLTRPGQAPPPVAFLRRQPGIADARASCITRIHKRDINHLLDYRNARWIAFARAQHAIARQLQRYHLRRGYTQSPHWTHNIVATHRYFLRIYGIAHCTGTVAHTAQSHRPARAISARHRTAFATLPFLYYYYCINHHPPSILNGARNCSHRKPSLLFIKYFIYSLPHPYSGPHARTLRTPSHAFAASRRRLTPGARARATDTRRAHHRNCRHKSHYRIAAHRIAVTGIGIAVNYARHIRTQHWILRRNAGTRCAADATPAGCYLARRAGCAHAARPPHLPLRMRKLPHIAGAHAGWQARPPGAAVAPLPFAIALTAAHALRCSALFAVIALLHIRATSSPSFRRAWHPGRIVHIS